MTFLEAMQALKEGKKVRNANWKKNVYLYEDNKEIRFGGTYIAKYLDDKDLNYGPWELYKELILNEKEKEYLSNVIKPFKNRVCYIIKYTKLCDPKEEYIQICVKSDNNLNEYISLPTFTRGSMYKKMKINCAYTIEDLDL